MYNSGINPHNLCPSCGGSVDVTSRFCNHCGNNLLGQQEVQKDVPVKDKSINSGRVFLLAGVSIAVLILILLIIAINKKNRSSSDISPVMTSQVSEQTIGARAQQIEDKILRGEKLSQSDISGLTAYELRVLRNVHFARYGRKYERPGLGDYFFTRSWYQPSETYNDKLITATDKANINMIVEAENSLKTASVATSSNPSSTTQPASSPVTSSSSNSTPSSSSSQLSTDKVQRAVDQALNYTKVGGGVTIIGVQEIPQENAARADVRFDSFEYNANVEGLPISKDKKTPPKPNINDPRFYEKMIQHGLGGTQVKRFSGQGAAILKHYNDGRWVLTAVHFDFVGVGSNIEIR